MINISTTIKYYRFNFLALQASAIALPTSLQLSMFPPLANFNATDDALANVTPLTSTIT
jgi:hypothetical protein